MRNKIYTIGHSTHPVEEFIGMLEAFRVHQLIDVRTIPKSRFNPQYNADALAQSLARQKITYSQMPALGGLRHPKKDSINTGWRNASFRGYADYMQGDEFTAALEQLMKEARRKITAIMCAEALPWRCHRSLIADALLKHKWDVRDIMGLKKESAHKLNPMAKIEKGRLYYPPSQGSLFLV